jgi:hypothetical protein
VTFIVAQEMIFGGANVAITRMLTVHVGRYVTRFIEYISSRAFVLKLSPIKLDEPPDQIVETAGFRFAVIVLFSPAEHAIASIEFVLAPSLETNIWSVDVVPTVSWLVVRRLLNLELGQSVGLLATVLIVYVTSAGAFIPATLAERVPNDLLYIASVSSNVVNSPKQSEDKSTEGKRTPLTQDRPELNAGQVTPSPPLQGHCALRALYGASSGTE